MSVTTFDTLKFAKRLKVAGMSDEQAEVLSEAFIEAQKTQVETLATKSDLRELELRINAQLQLLKWIIGFMLAGVLSLILKAFFIS